MVCEIRTHTFLINFIKVINILTYTNCFNFNQLRFFERLLISSNKNKFVMKFYRLLLLTYTFKIPVAALMIQTTKEIILFK